MKVDRFCYLAGILISIVIIGVGIKILTSPPDTYSTHSVSTAIFGADFYTDEYEATKAASDNVAVVANNIRELGKSLSVYIGTFYIFSGLLLFIVFSVKLERNQANKLTFESFVSANDSTNKIDSLPKTITIDVAEKEINKYIMLFDRGLISEEELTEKRNEIINKVSVT